MSEDWRDIEVPEIEGMEDRKEPSPTRKWGIIAVAFSALSIVMQWVGKPIGLPDAVWLWIPFLWIPALICAIMGVIHDEGKNLSVFVLFGFVLFGIVMMGMSISVWISQG